MPDCLLVNKKAMACVAEFGKGNFETHMEQLPGKQAYINETIREVRSNLKALIVDTEMLIDAALQGQLKVRADANKHIRRLPEDRGWNQPHAGTRCMYE